MIPRIITAEEARVLREAATPGPWAVDHRTACMAVVSPSLATLPGLGRDYPGVVAYWSPPPYWEHDGTSVWAADERPRGSAALIAAAPDLAATVEALHAEVARLRASMQRISGVVAAVAGVLDYAHETATRDDIDFDDMVVAKLVISIEPYSHGGWKKKAEALRAMLAEVTP